MQFVIDSLRYNKGDIMAKVLFQKEIDQKKEILFQIKCLLLLKKVGVKILKND